MRKRLLLLLVLFIGLLFPIINIKAEDGVTITGSVEIADGAEVFSEQDETEIRQQMLPLVKYGNIIVQTVKGDMEYDSLVDEAETIYTEKNDNTNGIIVLISSSTIDNNHNMMTVRGSGNLKEKENIFLYVTWSKLPILKQGEYKRATIESLTATEEYLTGAKQLPETELQEAKSNLVTDGIQVAEDKLVIDDEAGLLTAEEVENLKDVMYPLTEYGYIVFKTTNTNYGDTRNYAHNYYYQHFGNESGTMLIIDMSSRYIYICSAGNNYKVITKNKADIITDNIYRYASDGDYYGAAQEAFIEIKTVLDGGKIAEPMRYASNVVLSLVLGFLLTFFFVASSMKIGKASEKRRLEDCEKYVAVANVVASKTGTHKEYSPVESSGGGSGFSGGGGGGFSGGGGGGGGGFSGGGGGHSF